MSMSKELVLRAEGKCELCGSEDELSMLVIPPKSGASIDDQVALCSVCIEHSDNPDQIDAHHWRCLTESIWSTVSAVQVLAY